MINNIEDLIENKLACIDFNTKKTGEYETTKWHYELEGIKQALYQLGFRLELNVNPYYPENGIKSTFRLTSR